MDELELICKNCNHAFKWHEQATFEIWFCDYEEGSGNFCDCNNFIARRAAGTDGDEIEVQYDSDTYKWN